MKSSSQVKFIVKIIRIVSGAVFLAAGVALMVATVALFLRILMGGDSKYVDASSVLAVAFPVGTAETWLALIVGIAIVTLGAVSFMAGLSLIKWRFVVSRKTLAIMLGTVAVLAFIALVISVDAYPTIQERIDQHQDTRH